MVGEAGVFLLCRRLATSAHFYIVATGKRSGPSKAGHKLRMDQLAGEDAGQSHVIRLAHRPAQLDFLD